MKRTIKDLVNLQGKVVLLRVDFNVPVDDGGKILDTTRIKSELPTIKHLIEQKARVVIMSHLGRPDGYDVRKSLWPIALILQKNLPCNVSFCNSVVGEEVKERIKLLKDGDILLLENVRFYKEEEACDMKFAREIASYGDIFVDDAFAVAHRQHATNYGIARILPNAIGFLMEKEINELNNVLETPKRPFVAVLGGAKVETKVKILKRFIERADTILIGGAMAYTFLKALGKSTGRSLVFDESIAVAKEILLKAEKEGKKLLLPVDHVCVHEGDKSEKTFVAGELSGDMVAYDIGPKTIKLYQSEIEKAGEIFWNGPVGKFEDKKFSNGSLKIAEAIAKSKAHTSVGGGDTVSAVNSFNLADKFNFISTGGGASMKYLEDGSLPAIDVIQEKIQ